MTITSSVFLARLQRPPLGAHRPHHHLLRELPRLLLKVPLLHLDPPPLPPDPRARPHRQLGPQPQALVLALALALGRHLTPRPRRHWPN
jgi:hypothetical protein